MTHLTFRSSPPQQVNGWDRKPMDAGMRLKVHGPIKGLPASHYRDRPSWLRRLFGARP